MGVRRTARERALQALYALELTPKEPEVALEQTWASASADPDAAHEADSDPAAKAFARELVEGVDRHRAEIDGLISEHSHNWRLDRMSRIDRNILRVGVFELKFCEDIPRNVTLNEAIELGRSFSNQESTSFINGILDRIAVALGKT